MKVQDRQNGPSKYFCWTCFLYFSFKTSPGRKHYSHRLVYFYGGKNALQVSRCVLQQLCNRLRLSKFGAVTPVRAGALETGTICRPPSCSWTVQVGRLEFALWHKTTIQPFVSTLTQLLNDYWSRLKVWARWFFHAGMFTMPRIYQSYHVLLTS